VARIQREHALLLSYIQVTHPDTVDYASISSRDFIHNYYYTIDGGSKKFIFFILITYATNNDVVSWSTVCPTDLEGDTFDFVEEHLEVSLLCCFWVFKLSDEKIKRFETSLFQETYDYRNQSSQYGSCTQWQWLPRRSLKL